MGFELTPRERRWLDVVLFLAAVTLGFVVLGYLANLLAAFGDLILVFFLAWLLAFILSPLVARVAAIPFLPREGAVVIVYILLFGGLVILVVAVAGALASSISDFIAGVPSLRVDLPRMLAPWQARIDGLGLVDVDLPPRRRPSSTTSAAMRASSPGRSSRSRSPAWARSPTCS